VDNFVDCLGQINFFPGLSGAGTALAIFYPVFLNNYYKQLVKSLIGQSISSNSAVMLSFTGSLCISRLGGAARLRPGAAATIARPARFDPWVRPIRWRNPGSLPEWAMSHCPAGMGPVCFSVMVLE
jgi:hypothetical protein